MKHFLRLSILMIISNSILLSQVPSDLWVAAYLRADGHWKVNTNATYPENLKTEWIDWNAFNYLLYANIKIDYNPNSNPWQPPKVYRWTTGDAGNYPTDAMFTEIVNAAHANGKPVFISVVGTEGFKEVEILLDDPGAKSSKERDRINIVAP